MVEFIAIFSALVAFVVMPTTDPGIKINDTQDNSITLTAFENNFDRVDVFARGFCNKKGKKILQLEQLINDQKKIIELLKVKAPH